MKLIHTSIILIASSLFIAVNLSAPIRRCRHRNPLPAPRTRISPHETDQHRHRRTLHGQSHHDHLRPPLHQGFQDRRCHEKSGGGLVAWDKADRLGADEATLLLTQQPLVIGETTIPAGAYTLYIVPSETGVSKLAFSTNLGKWGIPVDETKDAARIDLVKAPIEKSVDQLTIAVENDSATGG